MGNAVVSAQMAWSRLGFHLRLPLANIGARDHADRQNERDRDELSAENHPIEIERRLPMDTLAPNNIDRGRRGADANLTPGAAALRLSGINRPVVSGNLSRPRSSERSDHRLEGFRRRRRISFCIPP